MHRIYYSILIICIGFSSCKENVDNSNNLSYLLTQDSLQVWISIAENPNISAENRTQTLTKIERVLDTISNDSIKLKALSELSFLCYKLRESEMFLKANTKLQRFAETLKDSIRLAEAYWDRGAFYDTPNNENRDSSYILLSKAQKIFERTGDDLSSARLLGSMAGIQTKIHDNTGALVTQTQAIKLLKPLGDNKRLFQAYKTLGIASGALNEYDKALEYYEEARKFLIKAQLDDRELASLENDIGLVHYSMGNFNSAKTSYQKAINGDSLFLLKPTLYAKLLDHLAMTDFKLGNMASVEDKLYRSQFIRDSIGDLEGLSRNYYNLAVVSDALGKKAEAFIFAENARDLAREIDNNLRYLESLKLLAELDPENANSYNTEYIRVSDSLQQEERRIRNKFDLIRFETEETQARNEQLSRQRLIWIGIAVGLLLFALALSIIVIQRIKNQRLRFQQQQQEANQEIFSLMLSQKQKVEEGKQSEQKRISEELHDGILGQMNGIRMILLGLNKKADDSAVALREQAIEKLKEVQEEIRSISHELNDASYQKFNNFMNSIDELLKNGCGAAGINYEFIYDHDLDWDNLEGVTKINLYRIMQESLQNCLKHADATSIYVSFEVDNSDMVITIQDNGRGFDPARGKKGIGQKNIASRMEKIRGSWSLKSAPGIGTTVFLRIPLNHISSELKKEISLPKDLQEA